MEEHKISFENSILTSYDFISYEEEQYYDSDDESIISFEVDGYDYDYVQGYEDYVATMNARTHFMDFRKEETMIREKDNIMRHKRRAIQLTKKAETANIKKRNRQYNQPEKKIIPKNSGRHSLPWEDFTLM